MSKKYYIEYQEERQGTTAIVTEDTIELTYPTGKKSWVIMTDDTMVIDGVEIDMSIAFDIPMIMSLFQHYNGNLMTPVKVYEYTPVVEMFQPGRKKAGRGKASE